MRPLLVGLLALVGLGLLVGGCRAFAGCHGCPDTAAEAGLPVRAPMHDGAFPRTAAGR